MLIKLLGLDVVPLEFIRGFERAIERVAFVYQGNADPDRPIEQMEEPFEELQKLVEDSEHGDKVKRLATAVGSFASTITNRPTIRRLVVKKLLRGWHTLIGELLEENHPLVDYLRLVEEACAGASLVAFASWPSVGADFQAKLVRANTFLVEASNRTGEARYHSTKNLARVVLDELYPRYIEALCILESVRIGKSVTPKTRQARSFGTMVTKLKESLPANALGLIDSEAHKVRNAFAHDHAHWKRECDEIELRDGSWIHSMPTSTLISRLEAMHTAYIEGMLSLLLLGSDFAVRLAEKHLTWEEVVEGRPAFEKTLQTALEPVRIRLTSWTSNLASTAEPELRAARADP